MLQMQATEFIGRFFKGEDSRKRLEFDIASDVAESGSLQILGSPKNVYTVFVERRNASLPAPRIYSAINEGPTLCYVREGLRYTLFMEGTPRVYVDVAETVGETYK